jgi:hypothetical protein
VFACIIFSVCSPANAAIIAIIDFSTDLDGWTKQGDGSISYSPTGGNPGGFLRSSDPAAGSNTDAFAPAKFLGDWSAYDCGVGFISADLTIISANGPHTEGVEFFISGPGGSASFRFPTANGPPIGAWNTYTLSIDQSSWSLASGSWAALLSDVQVFRIDLEFISGTEVTGLDNVRLATIPVPPAIWLFASGLLGLIRMSRRKE